MKYMMLCSNSMLHQCDTFANVVGMLSRALIINSKGILSRATA